MALSDCEHCWNTPCTCGWDYRDWKKENRIQLAENILGVDNLELKVAVPENHPMKEKKKSKKKFIKKLAKKLQL